MPGPDLGDPGEGSLSEVELLERRHTRILNALAALCEVADNEHVHGGRPSTKVTDALHKLQLQRIRVEQRLRDL